MARVDLTSMEAVVFDVPAHEALAAEVARIGAERVFILSSGTLNRETDEVEKLRRALGGKCAAVFDKLSAHVPRADVIAATQMARGVDADLIVTIGGGSPTDAAKAITLCLANDIAEEADIERLLTKADPSGAPITPALNPPDVPQISIPTTLSAGEFSAIAGVKNEATGTKEMLRHPGMMPRVVILDPKVARHTPEWLFLSTGIRAVDHCVEGVCAATSNPYGELGLGLRPSAPESEMGQADFLRLMTTQLQYQDPFKPMESGEFLGQIAQFSTVSGIQGMQESLDGLAAALSSNQTLQAASLVGRGVMVPSSAAWLGTEGDWYRWLRRYGVTVYFGGTSLAQLLLVWVLWPQRDRLAGGRLGGPIGALTSLVVLQWFLGVASVAKRLLLDDPDLVDRIDDAHAARLRLMGASLDHGLRTSSTFFSR